MDYGAGLSRFISKFDGTTRTKFAGEFYAVTVCPNGHDCAKILYLEKGDPTTMTHGYRNFKGELMEDACCFDLLMANCKVLSKVQRGKLGGKNTKKIQYTKVFRKSKL